MTWLYILAPLVSLFNTRFTNLDQYLYCFFQFQIVVDENTKKDLDLKVEVDPQEENLGKRMRSEIELAEMAATIGIGIGKIYR